MKIAARILSIVSTAVSFMSAGIAGFIAYYYYDVITRIGFGVEPDVQMAYQLIWTILGITAIVLIVGGILSLILLIRINTDNDEALKSVGIVFLVLGILVFNVPLIVASCLAISAGNQAIEKNINYDSTPNYPYYNGNDR